MPLVDLHPQIVIYLSSLLTMKAFVVAAKHLLVGADDGTRETILRTVALQLFAGNRNCHNLKGLATVEARIERLHRFLRGGLKYADDKPRGWLTRHGLRVTVVTHGLVQVHLLSYLKKTSGYRHTGDFHCSGFHGDQSWLFCLYAEYLSLFIESDTPGMPSDVKICQHFGKFWEFLVEYANVGGRGVVPPPRWAS